MARYKVPGLTLHTHTYQCISMAYVGERISSIPRSGLDFSWPMLLPPLPTARCLVSI